VAETFTFSLEGGAEVDLSDLARLDTCVTVVDAANFRMNWTSPETLGGRFDDVDEEDERNIVDLMTDQLEFADVILINKADLVTPEELTFVQGVARKMNSHAKIITTSHSKVRGLGMSCAGCTCSVSLVVTLHVHDTSGGPQRSHQHRAV